MAEERALTIDATRNQPARINTGDILIVASGIKSDTAGISITPGSAGPVSAYSDTVFINAGATNSGVRLQGVSNALSIKDYSGGGYAQVFSGTIAVVSGSTVTIGPDSATNCVMYYGWENPLQLTLINGDENTFIKLQCQSMINGTGVGAREITALGTSNVDFTLNTAEAGAGSTSTLWIERGSAANVGIRWNETTDAWELSNDGSTWGSIAVSGASLTGFTEGTNYKNTALGSGAGTSITSASGLENTLVGYNAGNLVSTGDNNVIVGSLAGDALTTGSNNTLVGRNSGGAVTGSNNVFVGTSAGAAIVGTGSHTMVGAGAGQTRTNSLDGATFVGYQAGYSGGQVYQTGVGYQAGYQTGGDYWVALGYQALRGANGSSAATNTVAIGALAFTSLTGACSSSVAVGYEAGTSQTSGQQNTYVGSQAGRNVTTGQANTHIGFQAGYTGAGTTAGSNTFVGNQAGNGATGGNNVYVGNTAGASGGSGTYNTYMGDSAGYTFTGTSVSFNVAIGYQALYGRGTPSGTYNAAFGSQAGRDISTGSNNVCVGNQAGGGGLTTNTASYNTFMGYRVGARVSSGGYNVGVGYEVMNGANLANILTGTDNVGLGDRALYSLSSGTYNVALGYHAAYPLTTGTDNVAIGRDALYSAGVGALYNIAIGYQAGYRLDSLSANGYNIAIGYQAMLGVAASTSGTNNVAVGRTALSGLTTGTSNVGLGYGAASAVTTGAENIAIGNGAGNSLTTGSFNICIGSGANVTNGTLDNRIVIGYDMLTTYGADTVAIGNSSVTNTYLQGITSSTAFQVPSGGAMIAADPLSSGNMAIRNSGNTAHAALACNSLALNWNSTAIGVGPGQGGILAVTESTNSGAADTGVFVMVGNSNRGYDLAMIKDRGTYSMSGWTKASVQSGDHLGGVTFSAGDGTSVLKTTQMNVDVSGTPATNNVPTAMLFKVGHNNSPPEVLKLEESQITADVQILFPNTLTTAQVKQSKQSGNVDTNNLTIKAQDADDTYTFKGGDLVLRAGDNIQGNTSIYGGDVYIYGGNGGGITGTNQNYQGDIYLYRGGVKTLTVGLTTMTIGKDVLNPNIVHEAATSTTTNGYSMTIQAQDLPAGSSGYTAAALTVQAGSASNGFGGALYLNSGTGNSSANAGQLELARGSVTHIKLNSALTEFTQVIKVDNQGGDPSTPTGGGYLYAVSGAGKWRGSSGTITTFGPADPHCPKCGRDFAVEWKNTNSKEHLAVCMWCLTDALAAAGIPTDFIMAKGVED